jgi:hypothetical protein
MVRLAAYRRTPRRNGDSTAVDDGADAREGGIDDSNFHHKHLFLKARLRTGRVYHIGFWVVKGLKLFFLC